MAGKRILVVEDDPASVVLMNAILEGAGYRVETVRDGASAIASVLREPPEIVLLDLRLPDVDGLELVHGLRSVPGAGAVRLVLVSAAVMPRSREAALAAGCDDYVAKPVDRRALLRIVEALIAGRAAARR